MAGEDKVSHGAGPKPAPALAYLTAPAGPRRHIWLTLT